MGALIATDRSFEPFSDGYPYLHRLTLGDDPGVPLWPSRIVDVLERGHFGGRA